MLTALTCATQPNVPTSVTGETRRLASRAATYANTTPATPEDAPHPMAYAGVSWSASQFPATTDSKKTAR